MKILERCFLLVWSFSFSLGFGVSKSYQYDSVGNISEINSGGCRVQYQYDLLHRLTEVKYPSGKNIKFSYDAKGNCTKMSDNNGSTVYVYDLFDRVVSVQFGSTNTLHYSYDSRGRLSSIDYGGMMTVNYQYDDADRLVVVSDTHGVTKYEYNHAANTLSGVILPSGVTTEYQYDALKRIISVVHRGTDRQLISSFTYTYDEMDNCAEVKKEDFFGKETVAYKYDKLNRLISMVSDNDFEKFTYDALGNRLTKLTPKGTIKYEYDNENRLMKAGGASYFYDAKGNLIKKVAPDKTIVFAYDEDDNLIEYGDGKKQIFYEYDGEGRRISKTINGKKTKYLNDISSEISQILVEFDEDSNLKTLYTYGMGRLCAFAPEGGFYFLYDHPNKNVVSIIDSGGSSLGCYNYYPFGSRLKSSVVLPNEFTFAGESIEEETGLVYLRNRYYDPEMGRFISADCQFGSFTDSQSLNPYVYAYNNPINFVDPLGTKSAKVCVYPPGTPTKDGPSKLGHGFWVLTKDDGEVFILGRYPGGTRKGYDKKYPGSLSYAWPATDEQVDKIVTEMYRGKYFLFFGNCINGVERGLDVLHVDHPSFSSGWGATPTKAYMWLESLNGKHDFTDAVNKNIDFMWHNDSDDTLFFEPPSVGDYGGVSLNKSAEVMGDISDIVGATYDPISGQIILMGQKKRYLPSFDKDDLSVAVRSIYGIGCVAQNPGVSIDLVRGSDIQKVRFEGATRDTAFGMAIFEADLLLKKLAMGQDFNGHITSKVTGYKSLIDRYIATHPKEGEFGVRLWLEPGKFSLLESVDGKEMIFKEAKMKVLTEEEYHGKESVDQQAKDFASHFTEHYDEFAKEFSEFEKLRNLGKITAIVKWMYENEIPLDFGFFKSHEPKFVKTPELISVLTTEASWEGTRIVRVKRKGKWRTDPVPTIYQFPIQGGIKYTLCKDNFVEEKDSKVKAYGDAINRSRPDENQFTWNFNNPVSNEELVAIAQPVEKTLKVGNVQKFFVDMDFGGGLELIRYYNSFDDSISELGQGWEILPHKIYFLKEKRQIRSKDDNLEITFYPEIVAWKKGGYKIYKIVGLKSNQGVLFKCGSDEIAYDKGRFILFERDGEVFFDEQGKMVSQRDRHGNELTYEYSDDQLKAIIHSDGKRIDFEYKDDRIVQAKGVEKIIYFSYNSNSQLASVCDSIGRLYSYSYDEKNNLKEILNGKNQQIFAAVYDDYHRVISEKEGVKKINKKYNLFTHEMNLEMEGMTFFNQFDSKYRLLKSFDSMGRSIGLNYVDGEIQEGELKYFYDEDNRLTVIENGLGFKKQYRYDQNGHIMIAIDENGAFRRFERDDRGRIKRVEAGVIKESPGHFVWKTANDDLIEYSYDEKGMIKEIKRGSSLFQRFEYNGLQATSICDPYGYKIFREYDNQGRICKTYDDSGFFEFTYDVRDRVVKVSSPISYLQYEYDEIGNLVSLRTPLGKEKMEYDEEGHLVKVIDAESNATSYEYCNSHLSKICFPNGTFKNFKYDNLGRLVEEN